MTTYEGENTRIGGNFLGKAFYRDPEQAFTDAMKAGVLMDDVGEACVKVMHDSMMAFADRMSKFDKANFLKAAEESAALAYQAQRDRVTSYVSFWKYIYSMDGFDYFKNICQRHYVTSKIPSDTN